MAFADGLRAEGFTPCARVRHGRQLAGAGGPRGRLCRPPRTASSSRCSTRPTRPPCTPRPVAGDPARRSTSSPPSPARRPSRSPSWPTSGSSRRSATGASPATRPASTSPSSPTPAHGLDHSPIARRSATVFLNPPDVGGRYSALTYVGLVPGGPPGRGPRRRSSTTPWRWPQACRLPGADNPGLALGAALGALARGGRDKVTFIIEPDIAPLRGVGRAAHRREHRQAGHRHRARRSTSRSARPGSTTDDRVFVRLARADATATPPGAAPPTRPWRPSRRPAIRSSTWPRRAGLGGASSSAGSSPRRWPAPCWASTPSTSPTSPSPSTTRPRLLDDYRARRRPPRRRPAAGDRTARWRSTVTASCSRPPGTSAADVLRQHLARVGPRRLPRAAGLHRRHARARPGACRHPGCACATRRSGRRPWGTARASCTRRASSTRAARRAAASSS